MLSFLHGIKSLNSRVRLAGARRVAKSYALPASYRREFSLAVPRWQASTTQIKLRPYQEESIQAVLKYLNNGEKRLGISLATGGGKTVIFSHLLDRVPPPNSDATQTLILAHRRELIDQAARHCRKIYPNKTVDVEMGKVRASGMADITVASIQSITSGDRLQRFDPSRFKLVLVDEAHHIAAQTYLAVLEHFEVSTSEDAKKGATALVGVSATFSRADGLRLGTAIDFIVYHKDFIEMIEEKWLSDVRFTTVESGANLSKVKSKDGDYQIGALSRVVNTPEINEVTVRSWLAVAKGRTSTLVFCVDLAHVAALKDVFRAHGYDALSVTQATPQKQRLETLASFKAGVFPVLINCGIYTEGTDIPNIDCIILARPTKSRNLLVQMVGRGLRTSPGKVDCHIIDMVTNLAKGLVTTPTLFGLDPSEIVEDATALMLDDLRRQHDGLAEAELRATSASRLDTAAFEGDITFTHFDDLQSLLENTSGERHIRGISRLAWVQVDRARYILSEKSGSYLTLQLQEGEYVVTFTRAIPRSSTDKAVNEESASKKAKSPYMRPFAITSSSTLEHAINAADTFARKRLLVPLLSSSAPWRSTPATPQQLAYLNRFRSDDNKLESSSISKGRAADWITKIKHGARGKFKQIQSQQAKDEKERERGDREVVSVGPMAKYGDAGVSLATRLRSLRLGGDNPK